MKPSEEAPLRPVAGSSTRSEIFHYDNANNNANVKRNDNINKNVTTIIILILTVYNNMIGGWESDVHAKTNLGSSTD